MSTAEEKAAYSHSIIGGVRRVGSPGLINLSSG